MSIHDVSIGALDGGPANLAQYRGQAILVVNVASKCGLTPQYASLQRLYETYADRGLVVLGVPCNQFGTQEPGTSLEIKDFCELNFGITFPITEKIDVNGPQRHELFQRLTTTADPDGTAGDVRWNFEKFLVAPAGTVVARFRPLTDPLSPDLVAAVEQHLPEVPPDSTPHPSPAVVATEMTAEMTAEVTADVPAAALTKAPAGPATPAAAPVAVPAAVPAQADRRGFLGRLLHRGR